MIQSKKSQSGFTLIEVLIALLILAIALSAVLLSVQTATHHTDLIRDKIAAHDVAMNVLSAMQVHLLTAPAINAPKKGESPMFKKQFAWTARIDGAASINYARVIIDVSLLGSHASLATLSGFIPLTPISSSQLP